MDAPPPVVRGPAAPPLLEVQDLRVSFSTPAGRAQAVDGVSFAVHRGETVCVVGESGCGKSVTALSMMGLVPRPAARIEGSIRLEGRDLLSLAPAALADLRGNRMAMIFQEPMTSLNPAFTVGVQLAEVLVRHRGLSAQAAREAVVAMLHRVRIPAPEQRVDDYPHRMSGGMRQRIMIAMSLLCEPALLIADEPTTALDVTIQAQVLNLMRQLRSELGTAIVLITHDLGVVAEMADRVIVMYAGQVVEQAPVQALFAMPEHPYTVGLMGAIPSLAQDDERLAAIDGLVPAATAMPEGCRFAPRCPFAQDRCHRETPPLTEIEPGHWSRCWRAPMQQLAQQLPERFAPQDDRSGPMRSGVLHLS
jgi:peptide/nickel transport system ATP-binding protein